MVYVIENVTTQFHCHLIVNWLANLLAIVNEYVKMLYANILFKGEYKITHATS